MYMYIKTFRQKTSKKNRSPQMRNSKIPTELNVYKLYDHYRLTKQSINKNVTMLFKKKVAKDI